MKHHILPKARSIHATAVRTAKEAAVRLARLEFNIARLEREREMALARAQSCSRELETCLCQRHRLLAVIEGSGAGKGRAS
ncbi:MAG: hypothetical protein AAF771_03030 [Pseudomonadota bacterium]